ncbi:uncharacterized protein CLUP02_02640 [Colletotrichum lupini]|uniref:Uncharacterized protein n=1 Tax=Colletotrichum lupini TaxID=145971 RepID=A0A9Q8SHF5_9PEZI|nr:uncharacterized protein CLUP02_02640 [Colletotrichum lupini]UQC77173.1 hypothetical protein CLUP02_02640 [Colletotrichum lupini]
MSSMNFSTALSALRECIRVKRLEGNIFTSLEDMMYKKTQWLRREREGFSGPPDLLVMYEHHFPTVRRDYTKDREYLESVTSLTVFPICDLAKYSSRIHRGYIWRRSLAVQKAFRRGYWRFWYFSSYSILGLPCFRIIFSYVRRAKKSQLEPAGTGLGYHDKNMCLRPSHSLSVRAEGSVETTTWKEQSMTSMKLGVAIVRTWRPLLKTFVRRMVSQNDFSSKPRDATAFLSRYLMCYTASLTETLVFISPMPPALDGITYKSPREQRSNLPLNHAPGHESAIAASPRQVTGHRYSSHGWLTVDFEVCSRLVTYYTGCASYRTAKSVKPFALIPSKPSTRTGKPHIQSTISGLHISRNMSPCEALNVSRKAPKAWLIIEFSTIVSIPNKSKSSSVMSMLHISAFNHSQPLLRIFDTRRNVVTDPSVSAGGPTEPSEEPRDPPLRRPPIIVALPDLGQNPHGITHPTIKSASGWVFSFAGDEKCVGDRDRSLQFNNLEKMSQSASGLWVILPAMAILSPHAEGVGFLEGIQPNSLLERLVCEFIAIRQDDIVVIVTQVTIQMSIGNFIMLPTARLKKYSGDPLVSIQRTVSRKIRDLQQ